MNDTARYAIPRRLDDPERWLFWTLDEAAVLLGPVVLGLAVNEFVVGLVAGVAAWLTLRRVKRRIRPVRPAHAAQLWLARFHALSGPPGAASSETKGKAGATTRTNEEETPNVTHLSAKKGESVETPRSDGQGQRDAA